MLEVGKMAEALRKAYRLCETDNQRRGAERASVAIAVAIGENVPGFSRALFLGYVKGEGE